jgi:hypothetical protein
VESEVMNVFTSDSKKYMLVEYSTSEL